MSSSRVIWIIGMSSSGKTSLAQAMLKILNARSNNWILLDGDIVRNIFNEDLDHTIEGRRINSNRITALSKGFAANGLNVIACVLSIFPEVQKDNRETLPQYSEVYIKADMDKLIVRDNKALYKQAMAGNIKNVVGVDIKFPEPYCPDIVIDNNTDNPDFKEMAFSVIQQLKIDINEDYIYSYKNRLKSAHSYQFADYEGSYFFKTYCQSREETLGLIERNLYKASISSCSCEDIIMKYLKGSEAERTNPEADEINTIRLLSSVLLRYEQDIATDEDEQILMIFLKKFEVSKRLYSRYHLDENKYKKASNDYKEVLAYLLLSNTLASAFQKQPCGSEKKCLKTILLNALLKINDTISSVLSMVCTPLELAFAYKAFKLEQAILNDFMEDVL